jgi:hypothetical protein
MFLLPEFDQLLILFSNAGMLGTKQNFLQQQSEQLHTAASCKHHKSDQLRFSFQHDKPQPPVSSGNTSQNTFATKHFQSGPEEELHNCF